MAQRSLIAIVLIVCVGYFAIWACAPSMNVRPSVPVATGQTKEYGLGVGARSRAYRRMDTPDPIGVAWWSSRFGASDGYRFGTALSFNPFPGLNVSLGTRLHETPGSSLWLEGELSLPGLRLSAPMAVALTPNTWFYMNPGFVAGAILDIGKGSSAGGHWQLPLGIAHWAPDRSWSLRVEGGLLTSDPANRGENSYFYGGIGLAFPYGN
jgi:hypothetical protein